MGTWVRHAVSRYQIPKMDSNIKQVHMHKCDDVFQHGCSTFCVTNCNKVTYMWTQNAKNKIIIIIIDGNGTLTLSNLALECYARILSTLVFKES